MSNNALYVSILFVRFNGSKDHFFVAMFWLKKKPAKCVIFGVENITAMLLILLPHTRVKCSDKCCICTHLAEK